MVGANPTSKRTKLLWALVVTIIYLIYHDTENRNAFGIFCEKLKKFKTNIDKCAYMVYNISTIKKTNKLLGEK